MNLLPCPYGDEECFEDDTTTLCDGCREDKAWNHAQGFMDTFD